MKQLKQLLLVMAIALTGFTPAQAQTWTHYSEWMANTQKSYVYQKSSGNDYWRYDDGLMYESILDTYEHYKNGNSDIGDATLKNAVKSYIDNCVNSSGSITNYESTTLDDIRPARMVYKYFKLYGGENLKTACRTVLNCNAFKDDVRVISQSTGYPWQHKGDYAHQVWLDGIFMGLPYWTLAGPDTEITSTIHGSWTANDYFDDAVSQMQITDEKTYEPTNGLWCHAWDATSPISFFWATKTGGFLTNEFKSKHSPYELVAHNGRSSHCWGRALGWFAMAIMETMDNIAKVNGASDSRITTLKALFKKVMDKVVETRDPSKGVWRCVIDVDATQAPYSGYSNKNNYLEATCSAMFTYCLLHGVAQGYLDSSYLPIAKDAYNKFITEFIDDTGTNLIMSNCMSVGGLDNDKKGNTKRDGSYAYYMSESIVENDSKGVGPFIWASLEAEKTYGYTISGGFDTDVASNDLVQFRWSRVADDFTVPGTTPSSFVSPTFTAKTSGGTPFDNATSIDFSSDNEDVATVDDNGTITLAGEQGTANIKATMRSGAYVGEAIYTVTTTGTDTTKPTLSSSTPATTATDVAVSGNITLTFSEDVTINDASNITLTGGAGTLDKEHATTNGATITIPYSGLANSTTYTLNIDAGAVKDLSENTNEDVNAITFTTIAPDETAPTLNSSTPANSATNVATSGTVVLTFSEAVTVANAADITISPTTGVTWGTATVDGTDNTKVNITYSGLTNETNYTVTIANNAITDLAGNAYTGSNFSFTTRPAGSATITIGNSNSASYAATFTSSSTDEHITASATAFTLGSSTTSGSSTYSSATAPYSVKIKPSGNINTSEYSDAYSASAQFTVTSGYTFSPSTISATIVTEAANYTYQAILTDGTTTYTSNDISSSSNGVSTFVFPSLSGTALSGTVTFKIRFKSTANNSKYFVVNLPITITGTVASASPTPTTYSVTYNGNGNTSGTVPTDNTSYSSGATVTVLGNTGNLAKTGYTFNGWNTAADGNGTDRAASSTFSISANTELFAKWTANSYTVTLNANTANHGTGENGSATATYNGTALSSITHTTAASGYARKGYYTAATEGTKVLNADGSFASANITDYITDSKWTRIGETTLYAQYEEESTLTTIPKGTTVTVTGTETLSNGKLLFNNRVQVLTSGGSLNSSTKLENGVLSLGTNNDYLHIKVPANSKVIVNAKAGSTGDNKGMYIGTSNNSTTKNYSPTTDYANYEYVSNDGGDIYIRRVSTTISIKAITVEDNSVAPEAPTFSPVSGTTVSGSQNITMSGPEGSTIYYKWDTSAPTASDLINNNQTGTSTAVESGKTLYAVAKVGEDVSSVANASYTIDSTAPTLSSSTPANEATNVAQSTSSIVLTESETVTAVGENIAGTIKVGDAEATAITFTLTNGNTLTYNLPTLNYSTTYVVKLSANQVQDGVGNQNAEQTVTFTTEAAPPATYSITATSNNNTWGTVSVEPTTAAEGATVTITTTPASGYRLTNLTATDANEGNVTITNNQFTMPASNVTVNATFAAMEKVATPSITGTTPFTDNTTVTITCATTGATIHYTTDGSTPIASSATYSSPIAISATTTVKAIAIKSGMTDSDVASATFTKSGGGEPVTYKLVNDPTGTPTLSGDFLTANLTLNQNTAQTIDGIAFKKGIKFGSSLSSISNKAVGENNFCYDIKTSQTKFTIYVAGTTTGNIRFFTIAEGATTTSVEEKLIDSNPKKLEFTFYSSTNTRVGFSVSSTSMIIYQVLAEESGTPHKQAGEAGYVLNLNCGRYAGNTADTNPGKSGKIDNIEIVSYNNYKHTNTTALQLKQNSADTYIKFTTGASACKLKATFSAGTLIANTSQSTSGGIALTTATAQELAANTTYYIINTNSSNPASISKIEFEAAAAPTTYDVSKGTETNGTFTISPTSAAAGATITVTTSPESGYSVGTVTATKAGSGTVEVTNTATNTYTFTMPADDVTVNVTFEEEVAQVATPTISPVDGTVFEGTTQNVSISCATAGANIYYTLDGTTPTSSSTHYTAAFTIYGTKTVKAIAIKEGMTNSIMAAATITNTYLNEYTDGTLLLKEAATDYTPVAATGVDVTLTRTLQANKWNALCLPFDVTPAMFSSATNGATTNLETLKGVNNGIFTFAEVTEVAAGTPFIAKPASNIVNPTFSDVEIKAVSPGSTTKDGYKFQGTYTKVTLDPAVNLFISMSQQKMVPPTGSNILQGLRAYFTIPEGEGARVGLDFNAFIEEITTDINQLNMEHLPLYSDDNTPLYNLSGQRVSKSYKGIVIVNGKKVLRK